MSIRPSVSPVQHPALQRHLTQRAENVQNRIADTITRFAGSMAFVYVSIIWFALWIGLHVEKYPYGLLTMIVSLEAIFLSTFVMISQNRADEKRQVLADNQWKIVQYEEAQNDQLIELTKQILELTKAIHSVAITLQSQGGQGQSGS
jgi:uncharacterized membrane protein